MELMDFKCTPKDAIIKWYVEFIKRSELLDGTHLKTYKENISSALDYYLGRKDVTNEEIENLLILILSPSNEGYHIKDGEKYGEYTVEEYRKWFNYYQKVHLENTGISIESKVLNKVKEEIMDILKGSD